MEDYTLPRVRQSYKGENPQYLMTFTFKSRVRERVQQVSSTAVAAGRRRSSHGSKTRSSKPSSLSSVQEGENENDVRHMAATI